MEIEEKRKRDIESKRENDCNRLKKKHEDLEARRKAKVFEEKLKAEMREEHVEEAHKEAMRQRRAENEAKNKEIAEALKQRVSNLNVYTYT